MLHIGVALLPVLLFLGALLVMDSFKLVPLRSVLQAILAGGLAAFGALHLGDWLFALLGLGPQAHSRYVAPLVEELLKCLYVVFLLQRRRVGFLVDAAILGFAVGAGFAVVENLDYLSSIRGEQLWLWIVRGLGPGLLHGATTTVFAVLAKSVADLHPGRGALTVLPGFAAAVALHSLFNHFLLPPLLSTGVLLAVLPVVVVAVFEKSETATREWLGAGFDLDVELLQLVLSSDFGHTRLGSYLHSLRRRFPGPVVADMFCLLRLELELKVRVKGVLMARELGLQVPVGEDVRARLAELRYLEKSIGKTGLLALKPLHVSSVRDLWHRHLLEEARSAG